MKIILSVGAVAIVVLAVLLFTLEPATAPSPVAEPEVSNPNTPTETPETEAPDGTTAETPTTGRIANPDDNLPNIPPVGKLKVGNFTGTLQEVNTGCFSDGECYVVVDGKHITTTIGWSQDTVGTIIGVPSFGDLESYIGKTVEVYAKDNMDSTYTLYGSEGFYVKVAE